MAQMPEAIILRKTEKTKTGVTYCIADVKTNADRIRSMSDGELAQFLMDSFACSLNCPAYDICDAEGACVEFLAKWLQQEADI